MIKNLLTLHFFANLDRQYLHFHKAKPDNQYLISAKSFKFLSMVSFILLYEDFYFMTQAGSWSAPYVKNN